MIAGSKDLSKELLEAITVVVARWGGKVHIPAVDVTPEVLRDFNALLSPCGVQCRASLFTQLTLRGVPAEPLSDVARHRGPDLLVFTAVPR